MSDPVCMIFKLSMGNIIIMKQLYLFEIYVPIAADVQN